MADPITVVFDCTGCGAIVELPSVSEKHDITRELDAFLRSEGWAPPPHATEGTL